MKMNSFSYYIWLSTVQFCHEFKINVILIVSMLAVSHSIPNGIFVTDEGAALEMLRLAGK